MSANIRSGTGKSFIGALLGKIIYDHTTQAILVICFTNHALDQFLEDLMNIGIPQSAMIRLGGKSTDKTKPLMLREQGGSKLTPNQWDIINKLESRLSDHFKRLQEVFKRYQANVTKRDIMDYLEFAPEELPFIDCFTVSDQEDDDMAVVGRRNKRVDKFYLLDRWVRGHTDAGAFKDSQPGSAAPVWAMSLAMRDAAQTRWRSAIIDDIAAELHRVGQDYNKDQQELEQIRTQRNTGSIKDKRIIACTTNGAATYATAIQAASPGVVLVEEAGEILESHILAAMGPQTEQLILIGDHQQLRPKCSYELDVTSGNGYDLNRSLFERLVLKGMPHTTLMKQHRMRPEISSIIRYLTYPHLSDADSTKKRDNLRGFQDNVMFINHSEPEIEMEKIQDLRDMGSKSSKQNDLKPKWF